jgi:hypothetical protein
LILSFLALRRDGGKGWSKAELGGGGQGRTHHA